MEDVELEEPNGSALVLLEDQGLERLCEVLSTDAVVSLFCKGFKVLFGGGKPLLIFGVFDIDVLRKSANASLLVLERVTGTALKGSLLGLLVASDFQADEDPKGSVGTAWCLPIAVAAGPPKGSSLAEAGKATGLDLAKLLAENGSKESSKLLLTGTT